MKETKFKVWNKTDKKWMDECFFAIGYDGMLLELRDLVDYTWEHVWEFKYEVIWYTGLKDKNDKEIYEGDIVFTEVLREQNVLVEFIMGCFYPFINGEDIRIEAHDVEVIGNIYENPDIVV